MKKEVITAIVILLLALIVLIIPNNKMTCEAISIFVDPTPPDNNITTSTFINITASITESNLKELVFGWQDTNYTIYDDDLVLMYNFDKLSAIGESDTKIVDASKYSNNGTTNNAVYTSSGKYSGAYSFDGIDDYVNVSKEINKLNSTYIVWIKQSHSTNHSWILHGYPGGCWQAFIIISYPDNKIITGGDCNGNADLTSSTTINENQWYHLAVVREGIGAKIYINGKLDSETNDLNLSSASAYTAGLIIGTNAAMIPAYSFNGTIDELRIWNRSLSAEEINNSYFSNLQKYEPDKWAYEIAMTGLEYDNYTYLVYAKNTSDNINITSRSLQIISSFPTKNQSSVNIYASPGTTIANNSQVNITCNSTNPEASVELYRNNVNVTTQLGINITLTTGNYIYICNITETQNYSSASTNLTIIVGNATTPPSQTNCTTNWTCSGWSTCLSGQQSRTCVDENNCNITTGKPSENQSCGTCTPNWNCGNWSKCENEIQTRTCRDSNSCQSNKTESRSCESSSMLSTIIILTLVFVVVLAIVLIIYFSMKKEKSQPFGSENNFQTYSQGAGPQWGN